MADEKYIQYLTCFLDGKFDALKSNNVNPLVYPYIDAMRGILLCFGLGNEKPNIRSARVQFDSMGLSNLNHPEITRIHDTLGKIIEKLPGSESETSQASSRKDSNTSASSSSANSHSDILNSGRRELIGVFMLLNLNLGIKAKLSSLSAAETLKLTSLQTALDDIKAGNFLAAYRMLNFFEAESRHVSNHAPDALIFLGLAHLLPLDPNVKFDLNMAAQFFQAAKAKSAFLAEELHSLVTIIIAFKPRLEAELEKRKASPTAPLTSSASFLPSTAAADLTRSAENKKDKKSKKERKSKKEKSKADADSTSDDLTLSIRNIMRARSKGKG